MSSLPLFNIPILLDEKKIPSLRPYQQKAINLARGHVNAGKNRIVLAGPTGAGKMTMIAAMTRTATVPTMFVCHRLELVDQCADHLARHGVTSIGVMRGADDRVNPSAMMQVASIQTLMRRKKPVAGLIFIDECHRSLSDSYVEHIFDHYVDSIIIGLTASPCRTDGRPLGSKYEVLEVFATYSELFKRSDWLVEPDCYSSPLQADLSSVPISHGDYQEEALGEVMSDKRLVGNMLDHWLKLSHRHPMCFGEKPIPGRFTDGERRRTFIFATNIKHSLEICARFEKAGVKIAHLDGTTPENERRAMLVDIRAGRLECISNCNVLLEGVDAPEVKCVVHGRPTFSLVLWLQSCGRIFRPWTNPHTGLPVRPLILDHAGNWDRHGPPHEDRQWSLTNVAGRSRNSQSAPMKLCKTCFAYCALGCAICPYCAAPFTPAEMKSPKENEVELQQRSADPEVVRREFFDKLVIRVKSLGYKPGFASFRFKEHYGDWPPRMWSDSVKASFASDLDWQNRVAARAKRKEEEEKAMSDEELTPGDAKTLEAMAVFDPKKPVAELETWDPPGFDTYEDGEEKFHEWVDRVVRQ